METAAIFFLANFFLNLALYRRPPRCTPAQPTTCREKDQPDYFSTSWNNYTAHHDISERARPIPAVFQTNIRSPRGRPAYCQSVNVSRSGNSGGWSGIGCEGALISKTAKRYKYYMTKIHDKSFCYIYHVEKDARNIWLPSPVVFDSSCQLQWSLTRVSYIPYYVIFRFNNLWGM